MTTNTPFEDGLDEKICTRCRVLKPLDSFPADSSKKTGRKSQCRDCSNTYYRKHYIANKDKKLATSESYRLNNWDTIKRQSYERLDPLKHKARQAVNNAIKAGKFAKKPCRQCLAEKAEFHHTNGYDEHNWFIGVWLCRPHHHELHRKNRDEARNV